MQIELLNDIHDVKSFTCGEQQVDDFLREEAIVSGYGQTWVAVNAPSNKVIAYYTIDPDPLQVVIQDPDQVEPVGYVRLQMIGADKNYQKQGIGTLRLIRSSSRSWQYQTSTP